ncbi:DUF2187 family protein [Bacillus sp. DJP31]|uniref:DUF2187 family protein n=1 Tax=Bacillus sp. DJP31 TaxID=3409789 RepID=UPI003BB4E09F
MTIAKVGEVISFSREGSNYEGVVSGIRENSVIVDYGDLKDKSEPIRTIVSHKNYKILNSEKKNK